MKKHSEIKKLLATIIFSAFFVGGCSNPPASSLNGSNNNTANNSKINNSPAANNESNVASDSDSKNRKMDILFDFRNEDASPKPQKIEGAEAEAVLKYVFGANHRTTAKDAGVDQRISGAFTKPNAKETLYFVRGGTEAEQQTLARGEISLLSYIVIFDGTTPILKTKLAAFEIDKITDLDLDGKNELLIENGGYGQGISETGLELIQIANGGTRTIKDFGILYEDPCDSAVQDKKVSAGAVYYEPATKEGDFPPFEISYYGRGCNKSEAWEKLAKNPFAER